jgi:CHAT domain-containing protein
MDHDLAVKSADPSRAQTWEEGLSSRAPKEPVKSAFNSHPIARRLNSTLLFYWLGEGRSYLWVITSAKTSMITLPASAAIDSAVKSYRQSVLEPRDPVEAGNADGKKLYSLLIAPVEKLIPRNSRVVVLPDGSLNSLNFETLIVSGSKPEDKAHYWIEDVTITTANSLALLSRSSVAAPPKDARLLVVGDALAASPDFPPLPQAGKEVGLLENYFVSPLRLELTGANATATCFLSSEPEKIHLSAFRDARHSQSPSSVGVGGNPLARRRILQTLCARRAKASFNRLSGNHFRVQRGRDEIVRRRRPSRPFLGVSPRRRAQRDRRIVGSQQRSTPQLMDELYKGIHAGQDPATALRNAKLTQLHSGGNYRRPFYWAPFLLYSSS